MNTRPKRRLAEIHLEDGTIFTGYFIGESKIIGGEIVFNTSLTGYQEIMTDPSYRGQIVVFANPHIGNTGICAEDFESDSIHAKSFVMTECCTHPSNYRSKMNLMQFLKRSNCVAIAGVNTRCLIEKIRDNGEMMALILPSDTDIDVKETFRKEINARELNPIASISTKKRYQFHESSGQYSRLSESGIDFPLSSLRIIVYDFGLKRNILRMLVDFNAHVTVVPATFGYEKVASLKPDGIVLSNGPGDPRICDDIIINIRKLLKLEIPILGICMGHQLLALAGGCSVAKLKYGHHGANHPILDLKKDRVLISSQNHCYAVDKEDLPTHIEPIFISLFDNSIEGIRFRDRPFWGVQFHPEASPGPHDCSSVFNAFLSTVNRQLQVHEK